MELLIQILLDSNTWTVLNRNSVNNKAITVNR